MKYQIDWQHCRSVAVIGLGKTGCSVIRYLHSLGKIIYALDQCASKGVSNEIAHWVPLERIFLGELNSQVLMEADLVVVSPGVSLQQPQLLSLVQSGKPVVGDIELFCQFNQVPIIAVTGSNGKTTCVTLLQLALQQAGKKVAVAGNIGCPALDILTQPDLDYVILELSSFQLQSLHSLRAEVSVVLNCTPDHLDWHVDMDEYLQSKLRIYRGARHAVVNIDLLSVAKDHLDMPYFTFGEHGNADFTWCENTVKISGHEVLNTQSWCLQGQHHYQNALALIAVLQAIKCPLDAAHTVLQQFSGIPHRCQKVAELGGAAWYNDSKATNEGACIAAVQTLSSQFGGRLILILGGDAKGMQFEQLPQALGGNIMCAIVLGAAQNLLMQQLSGVTPLYPVSSLRSAVELARKMAQPGDCVLLSPACASFDMFDNYQHRGDVFTQCVVEGVK